MKSRAIPEDFDRTSTLYSAFSTRHQPDVGSKTLSPYGFTESIRDFDSAPGFGHSGDISGEAWSSSVRSAHNEPLWTPGSILGSSIHSPIPSADERAEYTDSLASHLHTPNEGTPYAQPRRFPSIYSTSTQPRSRIRAESWASQPSAAFTSAGDTRYRSSQTQVTFARPTSPAPLHQSGQSHMGSPFHGIAGYSPPNEEPPRTQSGSDLAPGLQLQQAQPTDYESLNSIGSAYTTFEDTQHLPQSSAAYSMMQSDQPTPES